MRQLGVGVLLLLFAETGALAQAAGPPVLATPRAGHVAGPATPAGGTLARPTHEPSAAERAANLAEGRRKFFGQEQGFESNTVASPVATNVFPVGPGGVPIVRLPPKRR